MVSLYAVCFFFPECANPHSMGNRKINSNYSFRSSSMLVGVSMLLGLCAFLPHFGSCVFNLRG